MAKKESIQNFKIDTDVKEEFKELCEVNHTTPSHELRLFVHSKIQEFKTR